MSKDVIFMIVDSLCQHNVGTGYAGVTATPFLDSIENECITCSKTYSQGPYTEAATKSLLCGEDTLSSGGYLLRYANADSFITDEYYKNGYETICYMYPTALLSLSTLDKTHHMIYTGGFEFVVIWKQKLLYYAERNKREELEEADVDKCVQIMELTFSSWNAFLNPNNADEAYRLIRESIENYDLDKNRSLLSMQIQNFERDKKKYVEELLLLEQEHELFKIDGFKQAHLIHKEVIASGFERVASLEPKFKKCQIKCNKKNNKYTWKKRIQDTIKFARTRDKYCLGKWYNYYSLLKESKDIKICKNRDDYKTICSAKTVIDDAKNMLSQKTDKPKFVFIHFEDTHYFSTFFSYDSKDIGQIEKELVEAEHYIDKVSTAYKGNLMYDLSIRYVDKQIRGLFESIKKNNNLNNSIVCITSDHGYSYNRYPLRERLVNNFHEENYHIPVYIYAGEKYKQRYDEYMLGKDIVATLYDLCGFDMPNSVTGRSILRTSSKREYVLIEYMGPGCPDMRNREAWICGRNDKRMVAVKAKLSLQNLEIDNIVEAYNLECDPLEEYPLQNLDNECLEIFSHIVERWKVLKLESGV